MNSFYICTEIHSPTQVYSNNNIPSCHTENLHKEYFYFALLVLFLVNFQCRIFTRTKIFLLYFDVSIGSECILHQCQQHL